MSTWSRRQVHELDVGRHETAAQEGPADACEALRTVGRQQPDPALARPRPHEVGPREDLGERERRRPGRVDDGDPGAEHPAQGRREHREVGAAEHERVGMDVRLGPEQVVEVAVRDRLDDRPVGPALLGQRNEQRAGPCQDLRVRPAARGWCRRRNARNRSMRMRK